MSEEAPQLPRQRFATTRWSVVLAAAGEPSDRAREALETLLQSYWYPLYAFARRQGLQAEDASDATQGFFARLLEKHNLQGADREKGRFRNYLLGAFRHFLANEKDKAQAKKRGGGMASLRLDFVQAEQRFSRWEAAAESPERSFEREWAIALLEESLRDLEKEWIQRGKGELFRALSPFLAGGNGQADACAAARAAGLSEGAFKVAAHRLRQEFRTKLHENLGETVSGPEERDSEIRDLFRAFEK